MRWDPADKWVFSEKVAHPPIIGKEDFELTQATLGGRGSKSQHKQHRRTRSYALRGVMLCGRRMGGKWNYDQAYYLCRFPAEYALANKVDHPRTSTCGRLGETRPLSARGSPRRRPRR